MGGDLVRQEPAANDPLKTATIVALARIVDPLIDLMFDTGVTVHEFSKIVRERAVRRATARLGKDGGRLSKSQAAILTGLPRSEVARILKAADPSKVGRIGQHPARKVLAGWYDNPMFLSDRGDPLVLPIFGPKRSFERLVARYSAGIPVRAMLDQLVQINALEVLPGQRVSVKSRVPTFTGLTGTAIAAIGDRARDLLDTLRGNLRAPTPLFEGTAVMGEVDVEAIPVIKRELAEQAAIFIAGANSLFSRSRNRLRQPSSKSSQKSRIGITTYYFQTEMADDAATASMPREGKRKNLRRRPQKAPKPSKISRSSRRLP
jgi:hypothetical protein